MADYAEKYTDKQADIFAAKIKEIYKQAAIDIKHKIDNFLNRHKARAKKMLERVEAGEITKDDYADWLRGQVFQGRQWKQRMRDMIAVYVGADTKARELLGGTLKNVFVEAANYTAYDIASNFRAGIAFNIYDKKTVERLLKDNPKMLPEWKINEKKDYIWNEKRVQNALAQGIIQGESIGKIRDRLTEDLSSGNADKMYMFARTVMTGAQNAGRVERMREADKEFGIKSMKQWSTVHDNRVRDTHNDLNGMTVDYDEDFTVPNDGRTIRYPGDPFADADLVYNCRCSLLYIHKGSNVDYSLDAHRESYKQWLAQRR